MVYKITKMLVESVRPGIRACELDALNTAEWAKYGYEHSKIAFAGTRIGHGMGLLGTEPPHIGAYDSTVLQPGMVFTIEPGLVTDYGCFQTEHNVVVTEAGCEVLNVMDWELRRIATI